MSHEENDGINDLNEPESELTDTDNTSAETEPEETPEPAPAPKKKKDKTVSKKTAPKKAEPKAKVAPKAAPVVKAEPKAKAAPKKTGVISEKDMGLARLDAEKFKMLGDATRISIIKLCAADGEIHVGAICEALGQSQPATSHHLALLRHSGMVSPRRDGKNNFYSLTESGEKMAGVLSAF